MYIGYMRFFLLLLGLDLTLLPLVGILDLTLQSSLRK